MSNSHVAGENRGGKSKHLNGGGSLLVSQAPIEVDHEGGWSRQELEAMNDRFVAVLEAAFNSGLESRASACAEFAGASKGSAVRARRYASAAA